MYDDDVDIYADYKQDIEYKNKLLNKNIVIDKKEVPHCLHDTIDKLEICNEIGNYIDYQMYEELLETMCKDLVLNKKITESLLNKLFKRYGRYV